jgi:hypothetical protein
MEHLRTVSEIDREIEAKRQELKEATGTPTEIYTRITGYYRPVRRWNRGKREEYAKRKTFDSHVTDPPEIRREANDTSHAVTRKSFIPTIPGAHPAIAWFTDLSTDDFTDK